MNQQTVYFYILLIVICWGSCSKDNKNPFDEVPIESPTDSLELIQLEPNSIEGLHANIFRPTCANSGCHDGNFEPDFRTIQSTYNTLVEHPIIKNDPQSTYTYRVVPNDVSASQLIARLTFDIDGQSGIMPLAVDPVSDWETNKETYIQHIKDWINAGAKNIGE